MMPLPEYVYDVVVQAFGRLGCATPTPDRLRVLVVRVATRFGEI